MPDTSGEQISEAIRRNEISVSLPNNHFLRILSPVSEPYTTAWSDVYTLEKLRSYYKLSS